MYVSVLLYSISANTIIDYIHITAMNIEVIVYV